MNLSRCKDWIKKNGDVLRCEGIQGHDSVHYSGNDWWPNKRGLPFKQRATSFYTSFLRWVFHVFGGNKP